MTTHFTSTDTYPYTYPYTLVDATELPERQARVVDISRYYRTGGINWPRLKEQFDGVVICAGVGFREDILLPEHIGYAKDHGVPYNTFHIPDPLQNMDEQAHWYVELPGVKEAKPWFDNECPYKLSREPTREEADTYQYALDKYHPMAPGEYSRWEILERQGLSERLVMYHIWIAHYLYEGPEYKEKYKRYEPFFEQRAWRYPPNTPEYLKPLVIGWQITDTGDARHYCANRLTKDPVYRYGMTNCDLNVSTIPHKEFMEIFTGQQEPEPPPPNDDPCGCGVIIKETAVLLEQCADRLKKCLKI